MSSQPYGFNDSPLALADINIIDATSLSSADKHFLRVIAHCLACFRCMADDAQAGSLPDEVTRLKWFRGQSSYNKDEDFLNALATQFISAGKYLESLADHYQVSPLELSLDHLIDFALKHNQEI